MDLKKFLPGQKDEHEEEYLWSLLIEPGWVQAGVWHVVQKMSHVVSTSPAIAWELQKELVDSADSALSSAVSGLPQETKDPTKTVFGVVGSWVNDGQIDPTHLQKIKHICSDLGLTPIGFVVLPEAIAHFVKYEEHTPLSAVLLGHYKESIEISVFKLGNLIGTTHVGRSVSLVDDVMEGLARFSNPDGVPSRFILYNGKESELEEARQELLAVDWAKVTTVKFLHHPKVELFAPDKKLEAVSYAGGTEVAGVEGIAPHENEFDANIAIPVINSSESKASLHALSETKNDNGPDKFGFTDVVVDNQYSPKELSMHENVSHVENEKEALGDMSGFKQQVYDEKDIQLHEVHPRRPLQETSLGSTVKKPFVLPSGLMLSFGGLFGSIKTPLLIGVIVLIAMFIGGFSAWWYYPKAEVIVYVAPRNLDERVTVTVNTKTVDVPTPNSSIQGNIIKTESSGVKTKETTGIKTVGEKAQGEITLYRVGTQLTLKEGSTLNGPGGLKFVLDDEVIVASGSASSPSETKTSITAAEIGADHNLASGASFTVSNYSSSDIEAKNEAAFSGGTSREVASVTAADQKDLNNDLVKELELSARSGLETQLGLNEFLIDASIENKTIKSEYSKKVGEEADNLELTLDLEVNAVAVDRNKLFELGRMAVESKVPEGFVLRDDQIELTFDLESAKDGAYVFNVDVAANLLPQVSPPTIAEKMRGKYPSVAEETLQSEVPGFVRAEIKAKPKLPGRLGTLPQVASNIDVQIAAER